MLGDMVKGEEISRGQIKQMGHLNLSPEGGELMYICINILYCNTLLVDKL